VPELVQPLIEAKADVRAKCSGGVIALHCTREYSQSSSILLLLQASAQFVPRYEHGVYPEATYSVLVEDETVASDDGNDVSTSQTR
jgi:hypothetical protein